VTSRLVLRPFTEVDRAPFFAPNTQAVMERIGLTRDAGGGFGHPALPEGDPLRRHVLHRSARRRHSSPLACRHE
jgi:hypothetical protein